MPSMHIIAFSAWLWVASPVCLMTVPARAADPVRLAVQKTGTLAWEIDVVRTHGLDTAADITITSLELASPEAGKIALRSGTVDVITARRAASPSAGSASAVSSGWTIQNGPP